MGAVTTSKACDQQETQGQRKLMTPKILSSLKILTATGVKASQSHLYFGLNDQSSGLLFALQTQIFYKVKKPCHTATEWATY